MFSSRLLQRSVTRPRLTTPTLSMLAPIQAPMRRQFASEQKRNNSGMQPREFDYYFDSRIDYGHFPHNYQSFMKVLGEHYDTNSEQHLENLAQMEQLNVELRENVEQTMQISEQEDAKLIKRGKFDARDRIRKLLDRGSPWLALGQLAGFEDDVPSGNIIAGIGMVHGRQCMILANNFTYKGGAYYPITVKKHIRAQEIAMQNNLPCIYLVDSAGAFLPKQDDVFPDRNHFGKIFYNQARMSAAGIPQIAIVMGSCTAGGAYVPAMSDEVVIVKNKGTIFLGGPPLVQAATGEVVTDEELGGAALHTMESGVADHLAYNEEHAIQISRSIVQNLSTNNFFAENTQNMREPEEPLYPSKELNGIIPVDHKKPFDMYAVLSRTLDGSRFHEFKEHYGTTLITGFGHLYGHPVGIVANNGVLFSESALKGAHFVQLCCQRKVPLLFLQNITGFMVGKKFESEGIAKNGAKLVSAVSNANVPKITAILGASYGAGNYGMCGRAYDPRFLFMLPSSKISVMGGTQASEVLSLVKFKNKGDPEKVQQFKDAIIKNYDRQGSSYYSTSRLWDDGIIQAEDLRRVLGLSVAVSLNAQIEETRAGVFRM